MPAEGGVRRDSTRHQTHRRLRPRLPPDLAGLGWALDNVRRFVGDYVMVLNSLSLRRGSCHIPRRLALLRRGDAAPQKCWGGR